MHLGEGELLFLWRGPGYLILSTHGWRDKEAQRVTLTDWWRHSSVKILNSVYTNKGCKSFSVLRSFFLPLRSLLSSNWKAPDSRWAENPFSSTEGLFKSNSHTVFRMKCVLFYFTPKKLFHWGGKSPRSWHISSRNPFTSVAEEQPHSINIWHLLSETAHLLFSTKSKCVISLISYGFSGGGLCFRHGGLPPLLNTAGNIYVFMCFFSCKSLRLGCLGSGNMPQKNFMYILYDFFTTVLYVAN